MFWPSTLAKYLIRIYVGWILVVVATVALLFFAVDTLELFRRAYNKPVSFVALMSMSLLRLPSSLQELLPFVLLISGLLTFRKLSIHHEMVIIRGAGGSVLQCLSPLIVVTLILGVIMVTVVNPLVANGLYRATQLENQLLRGVTHPIALSTQGIWFRDLDEASGETRIFHALRVNYRTMEFYDVTVMMLGKDNHFIERIDAETACLKGGKWHIFHGYHSKRDALMVPFSERQLATHMEFVRLQESFTPPKGLSFWQLPAFISMLQQSGFAAQKYRLYFYSLFGYPLLLMEMVMIAIGFANHFPRQGKGALIVLGMILAGFLFHYMIQVIQALAASGTIPEWLAVVTPLLVAMFLAIAFLLHVEEAK
jgi:lipopolysaccharide export system permease protein